MSDLNGAFYRNMLGGNVLANGLWTAGMEWNEDGEDFEKGWSAVDNAEDDNWNEEDELDEIGGDLDGMIVLDADGREI